MSKRREQDIARAFTLMFPLAPWADAEPIRQRAARRALRNLRPETALWLVAVAHVRHQHTDYETLLDEGYGRDAARFFILDDINAVLSQWRCPRQLVSVEELADLESDLEEATESPDSSDQ